MPKPRGLDPDLVAHAQAGDERALADLLRALEPILRSFFIRRIGVRMEVDDLVQNTLIRVHLSLPDVKDPARLKSFAMKGALFELQDLYRGRYGPKEFLYDPDHPPEQAEHGKAFSRIDIERALARLTPRARRILELREFGYRYEEIAEMIGSTEAAIKMQVKRSFEKLRDVLVSVIALLCLLPH
ncbi:MAG TPA: RNA polymerase sigma factor [Rhodothermales bacterium]|nr:RNA polymerase sigma factor [Rhodothermales bacterium]